MIFFSVFGVLIVIILVYYHFAVDRKPLLFAKGKIIEKNAFAYHTGMTSYYLDVLFADKSIKRYEMSKKQFNAVQEYDEVDITAKGGYLASIKKHGTQKVIIDKTIISKEADLAKAKPMPLNNKDTTAYDKWMAKESKKTGRF